MKKKSLKIVSRTSPLALWQAEQVKAKLQTLDPWLTIDIIGIKTIGDQLLDVSLAKIGGKGLFVSALEDALLKNEADIAVHSMKDLPAILDPAFTIAAILEREDARDALVSNDNKNLKELPRGAVVGTSSLRRQSQLLALRSDLTVIPLRGNVDTRLSKLKDKQYEAIILAAAGLKRLNLQHHIQQYFEPHEMLPAIAQGALAIECCADNDAIRDRLLLLNHSPTAACVLAERAINESLGGSCTLPLAGLATFTTEHTLTLTGKIGSPDGKRIITSIESGPSNDPVTLGQRVAKNLLAGGAEEIIASCTS
jgi:hydroxymethylbilane synthase